MPSFAGLESYGSTGPIFGQVTTNSPRNGWDTGRVPVSILVPNGSTWFAQLNSNNLGVSSTFTHDGVTAAMYIVDHTNISQRGGQRYSVDLQLMGSIHALTNNVAKVRRTQISGGVESVTVEAPVTAYVGSTNSMWVNDGSDWVDTQQAGQPAPGQLSVASPSGLPNSISLTVPGGSALASAGGRIRFMTPRVSFQDQYITDSTAQAVKSAGFHVMGWGTLVTSPTASPQNLGGSLSFDTTNLPSFSVFSTPPQFDGIQMPFGWVLTGRTVEPLLDASSPLYLVTDTFTYYQRKEFM